MQTVETVIDIHDVTVVIRAWYCTPADGWFWNATVEGVGERFTGTKRAWASARLATEDACATLARMLDA